MIIGQGVLSLKTLSGPLKNKTAAWREVAKSSSVWKNLRKKEVDIWRAKDDS